MSTKTHETKDNKTPHHHSTPPHQGHTEPPQHPVAPPDITPEAVPVPAAENDILREKSAQLEAELAGYKDKHLRLAAEFDNYRKRMSKQFESVVRSANDDLIQQIIPLLDNFERALEAAKTSDDFAPFHQGVEMVYRQLGEVLQKLGVQSIETVGREFDPHVHEAVQVVNDANKPAQVVVREVQKGYQLNDRVLRAAKVIVNQ
jgi:molecular chaperone GrpE